MKCSRCQHDNPTDARFCEECATPLGRACSNCGAPVRTGAKFCGICANPLEADTTAPGRFTTPETYTPKHLAQRILTSGAALAGERKQVTVLFADLKGSMELLSERDPEEARKLLEPVLERMIEAVHRYEGTVNQVMGDGIMALFGAPLAHEDHAVRACYAALTMQSAIRGYAEELRRTQQVPPLQIRIGLNSGEVVVGTIGSDLRMEYTAVGQTTHLAARMEQLAPPGTTLLTSATLQLAEGYVRVRSRGLVPVKGLRDPVEPFELIGLGTVRTRFQIAAVRGLTKFVGRATELHRLDEVLAKACAGHGQVAALVGDAGVGKSRLVWEFTKSSRAQSCLVLLSSSVSYGKSTTYAPVIDLIRSYFHIEDSDDASLIREKLNTKIAGLDARLKPAIPPILALLDIAFEDDEWSRLVPVQRRQRIRDACKRLLLRESQCQPLILVFEDLHWVDTETESLLHSLVDSLATAPILLLVNYRPEYQQQWASKSYYSQMRIDPLPPESAEALIEPLLGLDPSLHPLKKTLIRSTEGNPLFLEESVRSLAETGAIAGERGAYRLIAPITSIQVPATVQAILAARIDRLTGEVKQLLQSAAVIGKDVPFVLLQAIAGMSDDELEQSLAMLQAAEFVYETMLFPDREYSFKHALTHDVAYGTLLHERRKVLHAEIVATIEHLYPDRSLEHVERLASHAFRGEMWEKAVAYLRQAGAKAFARCANREAVTWFEQALEALGHLPQTPEVTAQAIDIRFDLRNALHPLAELERLQAILGEARNLSEQLGDHQRLMRVSSYLTHYYWALGAHDLAIEIAERGIAKGTEQKAVSAEVLAANWTLGQAYHAVGRYQDAVDFFTRLLAPLKGELAENRFGAHGPPAIFSLSWLSRALAELGQFEQASSRAQQGLQVAEQLGHPFALYVANWGVGYVKMRRGDAQGAVPFFEHAVRLCKDVNIFIGYPSSATLLGYSYVLSGRGDEGIQLLEDGVQQCMAMGLLFMRSMELGWLGEAYLRANRLEQATRTAEQALEVALDHKERGYQAWILHLQGNIRASAGAKEYPQALRLYDESMSLARLLRMSPLVARCHFDVGQLERRSGRIIAAREYLERATQAFRELNMPVWVDTAHSSLASLPAS